MGVREGAVVWGMGGRSELRVRIARGEGGGVGTEPATGQINWLLYCMINRGTFVRD